MVVLWRKVLVRHLPPSVPLDLPIFFTPSPPYVKWSHLFFHSVFLMLICRSPIYIHICMSWSCFYALLSVWGGRYANPWDAEGWTGSQHSHHSNHRSTSKQPIEVIRVTPSSSHWAKSRRTDKPTEKLQVRNGVNWQVSKVNHMVKSTYLKSSGCLF